MSTNTLSDSQWEAIDFIQSILTRKPPTRAEWGWTADHTGKAGEPANDALAAFGKMRKALLDTRFFPGKSDYIPGGTTVIGPTSTASG
jgi:hypothetical protein